MDKLQRVFDYNGSDVRTLTQNGEPWFVAKDVCEVLDISNHRDAVYRLDDDERGSVLVDTLGGKQEVAAINEPGLYTLILRSRKPEAKTFKRWITHEVIPTIRKTGQYQKEQPSQSELILMLAQQNVDNEKRIKRLEDKAEAAHHRIDNLDKLDTIGDPQQRLNAMVRKYSTDNGLGFQKGWHDFRQAFNTAYRTNLTMLIENYKYKHSIKKLTMPEYLSRVDRLDDAIRVADKMLNQQKAQ
ncbi:Bro-N domain-containing protein [Mechercharimyces sp. CAU 1602]|uniref:BRO-N domain-containing protein n=1 Tax=Mechercharimyces sp. CAU 1602 TaxID=2973933 RepID=UPI002163560A|nr:Bro-N domain-containing protein [Mechercharimyces sp. CAU 1602]MCS1351187.1 Bro-N domain-containing protein [Mechercharimyces sp. CAU 1602]